MKRKILLIIAAVMLLALSLVLVSCGGKEPSEPTVAPAAETPESTAVPEPTPEPTATPEPTPEPTPTPVPEPGTYDLLNFEPDEDHMSGDGWDIIDGMWAGPLEEPGNAENGALSDGIRINGHREVMVLDGPDGEPVPVIRLAIDGDEGQRWLGNRYGIGNVGLKAKTKYKLTATFYLLGETVDGPSYYSILGYAEDKNIPVEQIQIYPKDEWQTVELVFKTSDDLAMPNIVLGPNNWACHCNYDYEISIADVTLFEIVEEESDEPADLDLLHFAPNGKHVDGDTWGITNGKFTGPLQAPNSGTENEAMKDGKAKYASRGVQTVDLPDGSKGSAIVHCIDADEGYRNSGNYYGIGDIGLKANTTYVLTVVLKFAGNTGTDCEPVVGFGPAKVDGSFNNTAAITDKVILEAKDEWQTVELEFTTPDEMPNPVIAVGPSSFIGEIHAGYSMSIASMKLVEKVPAAE